MVDSKMSSTKQCSSTNQEPVSVINLTERRNTRIIEFGSASIAIICVMGFGSVLSANGYSTLWILLIVALLLPGTAVHELCHYCFQWVFSGQKPYLGFKFPFPYSALAPGTRITRNQAIISALAPFIIITPLLILPTFFVGFLPRVILLAWASVEAATCFGDFLFVVWLLKHPKNLQLGRVGLSNALFGRPNGSTKEEK